MAHQASVAGQAVTRADGKAPDVPAAAGRKGFKAELDGLRERMHGLGFPYDEIAAEIARRYRARPREACRLAWDWTLEQAAARFNEHAGWRGADPGARASLTGSRLSEFEHWPRSPRKPSVYVLVMLAEIYETDVLCPLDLADHESLPQQDRLVLLRRPRAPIPFGKLVALMEARGLSAAETVQRVLCSSGYLCNVIQGRKRPSRRVAHSLDDVLEASGELLTLAEAAEAVTSNDDEPSARGNPCVQAPDTQVARTEGMSLSLPYVPGCLVIEISEPAGKVAAGTDYPPGWVTGQLALVPGPALSRAARAEATGA